MQMPEIPSVSNEAGEPTAEIESERETAYLLSSEPMKQRLLAAMHRQQGIPFETVLEKLGI